MQYTEDFKRGIVRTLLTTGMKRQDMADKIAINTYTLKKWVDKYKDEELEKVDGNNRSKYSEDYKKSIVTQLIYEGITYETMGKRTGISPQMLEYWDNKYRYIAIDEVERESRARRKKKKRKTVRWRRYGAGAGRYE